MSKAERIQRVKPSVGVHGPCNYGQCSQLEPGASGNAEAPANEVKWETLDT